MTKVTESEKLQLTLLDLLSEPMSAWDVLHDEQLVGLDPKLVGETLMQLSRQLRLKVYRQTLEGLFVAMKPDEAELQKQFDRAQEPEGEEKYWVQKETEM
jgi:hypothetical protein